MSFETIGPGGPIAWSGFDENGNYGVRYESGAETWISREILEAETDGADCPRCGGDMTRPADTPWITHPTTVCAQCVRRRSKKGLDRVMDGSTTRRELRGLRDVNDFNRGALAMLGLIGCIVLLAVVIWLSTNPLPGLWP